LINLPDDKYILHEYSNSREMDRLFCQWQSTWRIACKARRRLAYYYNDVFLNDIALYVYYRAYIIILRTVSHLSSLDENTRFYSFGYHLVFRCVSLYRQTVGLNRITLTCIIHHCYAICLWRGARKLVTIAFSRFMTVTITWSFPTSRELYGHNADRNCFIISCKWTVFIVRERIAPIMQ